MTGTAKTRIAIIGHVDQGKTSLTAAITRLLAENPGGASYEVSTKSPGGDDVETHRPPKP